VSLTSQTLSSRLPDGGRPDAVAGFGMVGTMTQRQQQVPADEIVRDFLRGQNLEQIGRPDEAVELYERAVVAGFDASGPYDRLIWLYQERRSHREVIRVAEASLQAVRTYPAKRQWYEKQIEQARAALEASPKPRPR
jgi:tetratricopeptide (TPR) repeat protein